jgi:hypothetical protein
MVKYVEAMCAGTALDARSVHSWIEHLTPEVIRI